MDVGRASYWKGQEFVANVQGMQLWHAMMYKYKVSPAPADNFGKGAPYGVFSTARLGMETQGSFQIGS